MTNAVLNFDTLACVKELKQAGFTTAQAEAQTKVLASVVDENVATKQDLNIVKFELKKDIELVRRDIELIKRDIVIKLGSMIAGSVLLLVGVIKFIH